MRGNHQNEKHKGNENRAGGHQIGGGEGEMLRQKATGEDADAQTEVPSGEVGGSGCASLCVGAKVDEQSVKRGEGCSKTQAATQSDQKESHCGVGRTYGIDVMAQP